MSSEPVRSLALPLKLTAVLLLLRPQGPAPVLVAAVGLAVVALLSARALVSPALWLSTFALVAVRIAWDWPLADNHIYLLAYWCLGIGLALGSHVPDATLRAVSRWLIACAFVLAVAWKCVLSPDYLDGRFFRVTLIMDGRFESLVRLAGGMDRDEIERHRAALVPLGIGAQFVLEDLPVEPAAFQRLARVLTWCGLVVESVVAAVFLAPLPTRYVWLRHAVLIAFCAVTYAVAPVAGFGWLLLAMGASQVVQHHRQWNAAYVAAWLLVLAGAHLPMAKWLADLAGRP